jgi:hypothetical protein
MKRTGLILLLLVAVAAALFVSLPPRSQTLTVASARQPSIRGAFHIHSRRSDGTGTPDEVAAAAARAGLKFVVLTDHDDAASEPATPYYRRGVLVIEAVEISTDGGHVVGLDVPRAPYPLAGEARDVIEDIARLGGFSIVAHPGSEKPDLRWSEWTAPFNGIEWLNGDSEWRDEPRRGLIRALFTYPFRRSETLATLLDRPEAILRRWDVLAARRRVVAVAAADAHGVGLRRGEPNGASLALHLPAYESMFRTFSITVSPVAATGDAHADARAVIDAIRAGHVYSSIDALAAPAALRFSATVDGATVEAGDIVPPGARKIELQVESNAPADARIVLLKDGTPHATAMGPLLRQTVTGERAVYKVEVGLPTAPGEPPVPWLVSNPIYVGFGNEPQPRGRPPATKFAPQYQNGSAPDWTVVTSPRSKAAPAGPAFGGYDRLMFTARADRPMRLSVQLRVPTAGDGERWHRSIYLDETARDVSIFFDDMTPRGVTTQRRPNLAMVRDVIFVVDTVNTKPGTAGQIWIDDVRYGR